MTSIVQQETQAVALVDRPAVRYAPLIAAAVAVIAILVVYADTAASIVAIWSRSETFTHGYAVVPIALWLAWRQRQAIADTPARPWYPGLIGVAAGGALWLVMSVAEVVGVRQFALVFMLQAAIVSVVGTAVARVAALPLLFVLFAVPAGEFLVPTMIDWTADFTVAALRFSGVPVFREANHFVIPSGSWSVVEACSGLRYLIASMMIGVLYAAVSYRSAWRRAAFIGASIAVPLVANWLRAYMIVMLGHLSNNRIAVGIDHLIYGWLFFGIVMALLFWVASLWPEPAATVAVAPTRQRDASATRGPALHFVVVAAVAIAIAVSWRPVFALIDDDGTSVVPKLAPLGEVRGFAPADESLPSWTPAFAGHSATLRQTFVKDGAAAVMYIAYYRNQAKGRELVTTANQLVPPKEHLWKEVASEDVVVSVDARPTDIARSVVSGRPGRLVVYRVYWIGGTLTTSDYVAKALLAWSKLRGRGDDAALVVFYAMERDEGDIARHAVEGLLPDVVRMLSATSQTR